MQKTALFTPFNARATRRKRLALPLATPARRLVAVLSLWRQRSRHRSDLVTLPESVRRELTARGMDLQVELGKPFWRP